MIWSIWGIHGLWYRTSQGHRSARACRELAKVMLREDCNSCSLCKCRSPGGEWLPKLQTASQQWLTSHAEWLAKLQTASQQWLTSHAKWLPKLQTASQQWLTSHAAFLVTGRLADWWTPQWPNPSPTAQDMYWVAEQAARPGGTLAV